MEGSVQRNGIERFEGEEVVIYHRAVVAAAQIDYVGTGRKSHAQKRTIGKRGRNNFLGGVVSKRCIWQRRMCQWRVYFFVVAGNAGVLHGRQMDDGETAVVERDRFLSVGGERHSKRVVRDANDLADRR